MVMDNLIDVIDRYYLDKLTPLKEKGTCLRKKVGAILVRNPFKCYSQWDYNIESNLDLIKATIRTNLKKDNYTVYESFNTSLTEETCESQGACLLHNGHCIRTLHPEIICILNSTFHQREQGWMYISTAPCYKCLQEIVYVGIKRIIVQDLSYWETHEELEKPCLQLIKKYEIELIEKV